ncbi:MAG: hypothetical protein IIZ25_13275 [Thermoguttaceae bacterium]|nr:hypothetical protein [Thermoguttaceae bacterium]
MFLPRHPQSQTAGGPLPRAITRSPLWGFGAALVWILPALLCGCTSIERHRFVFWGDIVTEKPADIQDHWSDYGPFRLNDPTKKLRRGKAGVIRFFKEKDHTRSIAVDGELIVYVYAGSDEGIELTEPYARLVLTSEQLNSQRKFDKKSGYSYHIWLDLGEIDDPPENISILTVFNDTKTRDQVASGITYTRIEGIVSAKKAGEGAQDEKTLDPVEWARKYKEANPSTNLTEEEKRRLDAMNAPQDNNPERTAEDGEETAEKTAAEPSVIDMSEQMARQVRYAPASEPIDEHSRYASYLEQKNSGRWVDAPEGTVFDHPTLTAMNNAAGGIAAAAAGQNQTGGPAPRMTGRKLTFDDIRAATGPTADGQYLTQGYVNSEGKLTQAAPILADQTNSRLY